MADFNLEQLDILRERYDPTKLFREWMDPHDRDDVPSAYSIRKKFITAAHHETIA